VARIKKEELERQENKSIELLALNRELPLEFFIEEFDLSESAARRRIKNIESRGLVDFLGKPTTSKGKPKNFYRLTLKGIISYLVRIKFKKIEEVAECHRDKLLTFKNWGYFEKKGVKIDVLNRLEEVFHQYSIQEMTPDGKNIDAEVLISEHILYPIENIRERVTEEEYNRLINIWSTLDGNYELADFRDTYLFQEKLRTKRELESLESWSKVFSIKHYASADLKASLFVNP